MGLLEQLQADYKQAFKDKNTLAKDVLSIVLATIKNKEIEIHKPLDDKEIQQILLKEQKAIKETLSYLMKTDKKDDIVAEEAKVALLAQYLPTLLSDAETTHIVQSAIAELQIQDVAKERGKLIGYVLQQYPGQVDPAVLQTIILWLIG